MQWQTSARHEYHGNGKITNGVIQGSFSPKILSQLVIWRMEKNIVAKVIRPFLDLRCFSSNWPQVLGTSNWWLLITLKKKEKKRI